MEDRRVDSIFYNAKAVTMDGRTAEAVCVLEGKIAYVGTNAEALRLKTPETSLVDLGGRLMLPGFIDTHLHFLYYGQSLEIAQLAGVKSKAELIEAGRAFLKARPGLEVLAGAGWNHDHWADDATFPKRRQLDEISREIPVVFTRACYHVCALNSKALEICGITRETPDMPGGSVGRDAQGEPDGMLYEDAMGLASPLYQPLTVERAKACIRAAARDAASCGLTSVHADDLEFSEDGGCVPLTAYRGLLAEGFVPMRVYLQCRLPGFAAFERFFELGGAYNKGDERLRFGPLKLIADGSLGARTAYMKKPYCDAPDTRGIPIYTQEELDALVLAAARRGMPCAVHAIGDETIEMALNAIEKARRIEPAPLRHAIVHCQITDLALLGRMKALGVTALVQPIFLDYDLHIADARVGGLAKTSYAFATMRKLGIPLAFGSDAPVERFNAIQGIYHAVTRKDLSGFPANGWYPEEKLTIEEAVAGFTRDAAFASCEEHLKGTLTEGKLADLVVLDRDIFTLPEDEIKNARVFMTVCGGEVSYRAE